ncbi:hypothetical protein GW17_00049417 [Ensete ventricosum]|nr:hypothetical protein GW17_00049417 [Ensete ventricosum]
MPASATPTSCCPCEWRWPPLRVAAPMSGAGLPYRLRAGPGRSRPPTCKGPWPWPGRGWLALQGGWPWLATPPPHYLRYENA